jgi:hypothetical protein
MLLQPRVRVVFPHAAPLWSACCVIKRACETVPPPHDVLHATAPSVHAVITQSTGWGVGAGV